MQDKFIMKESLINIPKIFKDYSHLWLIEITVKLSICK